MLWMKRERTNSFRIQSRPCLAGNAYVLNDCILGLPALHNDGPSTNLLKYVPKLSLPWSFVSRCQLTRFIELPILARATASVKRCVCMEPLLKRGNIRTGGDIREIQESWW